jgi:EAL and modified HD-GYP domain-containing signal transduction protein
MMSLLEAAIEIPLPQIIEELNLASAIRDALLHRGGALGGLLNLVEAVENCRFEQVAAELAYLPLTPEQLTAAEITAMGWADAIGREVL